MIPFIFIQVAVDKITAINIDDTDDNFNRCVSIRLIADDEPWFFRHGSSEAEALKAWASANALPLTEVG